MKIKRSQKNNFWKTFAIVLLVALVAWGVFALLAELSKKDKDGSRNDSEISTGSAKLLDDESASSNNGKNIDDEKDINGGSDVPETPTKDDDGLDQVSAMITYVGFGNNAKDIITNGMVSNSTDTSGVCTYVFNGPDNREITAEAAPLPSASSLACAESRQAVANFAKGTWTVKLVYKSAYSKGESNAVEFEVE